MTLCTQRKGILEGGAIPLVGLSALGGELAHAYVPPRVVA